MKKILFTIIVTLFCVAAVSAQDDQRDKGTETKKGYNILPAKGDFAIGVAANPFLNYGRGLLNGNQPAPTFNGAGGRIYGKYFVKDNQAFRFGIGIGIGGDQERQKVIDEVLAAEDPDAHDPHTFDKMNNRSTDVDIFVGYEWRRGYGRLQGVFGVQAGINFSTQSTTYKWGNEMNADYPAPTSSWGMDPTYRTLKQKGPGQFGFNFGGFVGAEFFFARKMSLGAELGLGFSFDNSGKVKTTSQFFDVTENKVKTETVVDPNTAGTSDWMFDANVGGNISLNFHF